jgi:hypothetical protein
VEVAAEIAGADSFRALFLLFRLCAQRRIRALVPYDEPVRVLVPCHAAVVYNKHRAGFKKKTRAAVHALQGAEHAQDEGQS